MVQKNRFGVSMAQLEWNDTLKFRKALFEWFECAKARLSWRWFNKPIENILECLDWKDLVWFIKEYKGIVYVQCTKYQGWVEHTFQSWWSQQGQHFRNIPPPPPKYIFDIIKDDFFAKEWNSHITWKKVDYFSLEDIHSCEYELYMKQPLKYGKTMC